MQDVFRDRRTDMATVVTQHPLKVLISNQSKLRRWGSSCLVAALLALVCLSVPLHMWAVENSEGGNSPGQLAVNDASATPDASTTCLVEPLSADEVMAIVRNPANGYVRLSNTGTIGEVQVDLFENRMPSPNDEISREGYILGGDPEVEKSSTAAAVTFWNCIQMGTAFQVWSLLDPALIQYDILGRIPVFRTEEQVLALINEVGPKLWSITQSSGIPSVTHTETASLKIGDKPWIGRSALIDSGYDKAIVTLNPHPGTNHYIEIELATYGSGQWVVVSIYFANIRG